MSTLQVYEGSVQYAAWPVVVTDATGAVVNPTTDTVEIACQPVRATTALDWHAATWVTDTATTPDSYSARVLLGQTPFLLAAGVYTAWIRITDNPETPILSAGTLYVTVAQ